MAVYWHRRHETGSDAFGQAINDHTGKGNDHIDKGNDHTGKGNDHTGKGNDRNGNGNDAGGLSSSVAGAGADAGVGPAGGVLSALSASLISDLGARDGDSRRDSNSMLRRSSDSGDGNNSRRVRCSFLG